MSTASVAPWDCDVVALLERAVLADEGITARVALHVEAARKAERCGWVTTAAAQDGVVVTVTELGAAVLDELYGPGWDAEVRAVRASLGVA